MNTESMAADSHFFPLVAICLALITKNYSNSAHFPTQRLSYSVLNLWNLTSFTMPVKKRIWIRTWHYFPEAQATESFSAIPAAETTGSLLPGDGGRAGKRKRRSPHLQREKTQLCQALGRFQCLSFLELWKRPLPSCLVTKWGILIAQPCNRSNTSLTGSLNVIHVYCFLLQDKVTAVTIKHDLYNLCS